MYTEDYFRAGRAGVLMPLVPRAVFHLKWVERTRYFPRTSSGFNLSCLVNEGIYDVMPRTKRPPARDTAAVTSRKTEYKSSDITWCNMSLSSDDIAYLTDRADTLADLGAQLLAIADEGYDFSVKSMEDGKSIMCAITGYATDDPQRKLGVSAFAPTVRDAALAGLYKFVHLCGGSFSTALVAANSEVRRFR